MILFLNSKWHWCNSEVFKSASENWPQIQNESIFMLVVKLKGDLKIKIETQYFNFFLISKQVAKSSIFV